MEKVTTPKRKTARESTLEKQQRQAMIRNTAIAIVAIFVVGAGIFYVYRETAQGIEDQGRPAPNPNEQIIPDEGAGHVAEGSPLTYQHYPPSSGTHYGTWAELRFHDEPVSEGYWIHNLEHGEVVLLYNCPTDCPDLKAKIRAVMAKAPGRRCSLRRVMAAPYSRGMSTPISLVAWVGNGSGQGIEGRQLDLAEFDEQAILNFYKTYEDAGPEDIPCR